MVEGKLLTAILLDGATVRETERRFAALLGDEVRLVQTVDPSLLGGVHVEIGGRVYDDSIRAQLEKFRESVLGAADRAIAGATEQSVAGARMRALFQKQLAGAVGVPEPSAIGSVLQVGDGIATVSELGGCQVGELLSMGNEGFGIAMNLDEDSVGVVILSGEESVHVGTRVRGTNRVLSVPVGQSVIGRVVDPLGQPIDGKGLIKAESFRPVEAPAPAIFDRRSVRKPMETGLIAIDATVPIGRGQRELIIGDRQTGKTSVAVDAILNQADKDMLCVYVAIGQKVSTVAQVIDVLEKGGAMAYTCVVCSTASDSTPMQYIAPYCGCAIAEHFMAQGRDVLIVYDDLSKHAVAHRTMSLLLHRPPGREAYPGDVFYLHSRLLERAACLSEANGGGSLTALPIVETQMGDISAYIPTNVISITDGQIFLDTDLFRAGTRPAINVGLSVSRVGGAAQTKAMRKVSGRLRLELAQYREMLVFSQFSSDMDETARSALDYGERLTEILIQKNSAPLSGPVQVAFLYALGKGLISRTIGRDTLARFKAEFPGFLRERFPAVITELTEDPELTLKVEALLSKAVSAWLSEAGE